MTNRSNHKRKPSCHHKSANKPGSSEPESGKPEAGVKTPAPPKTISKIILINIVLGVVAITAIVHGFDGLIEIKLGAEGGQVLIDGRKHPLPPPITDNSSNNN